MKDKDLEIMQDIYGSRVSKYEEGNYLIIAVPIHQDSPELVNKDGVTVGSDAEWRRVPWKNILGTFPMSDEAQS